MKILMISTDEKIFDKESFVSHRMIKYGENFESLHIIVFSKKSIPSGTRLSEKVFVYSTNSFYKIFYIFNAIICGKKIMKNEKFSHNDFITCQDPFETGIVGLLLKIKTKCKLETQIHTDLFSPFFPKVYFLNRIRLFISKLTLPASHKIRVVSKRIADGLISKKFNPEIIEIRPIAFDTKDFLGQKLYLNLKEKYKDNDLIVLSVCRLEKEKNLELAIRAISKAISLGNKIAYVIIGDGSQKEKLEKLSKKLKIGDKVYFKGWQENTYSYYQTADLYICTSYYEGYGLSLIEAETANLKIISTDVGIARELKNIMMVDYDSDKIAEKINNIIKNK